jgi:hypothetical protein
MTAPGHPLSRTRPATSRHSATQSTDATAVVRPLRARSPHRATAGTSYQASPTLAGPSPAHVARPSARCRPVDNGYGQPLRGAGWSRCRAKPRAAAPAGKVDDPPS